MAYRLAPRNAKDSPMEERTVWVYPYRYWDENANALVVSSDLATLDAIRSGLGVPVLGEGRKVPTWMVSHNGRFVPDGRGGPFEDEAPPRKRLPTED